VARYDAKQYVQISEERLDLADGDAIFYFTYAATDPEVAAKESEFIKTFQQKPLWLALEAVKDGQAFFVPGYWWRAQTYLLANLVIDDLWRHLLGQEPPAPASVVVLAESADARLIRHAGGETEVPANPQCIVVAGSGYLDHLLTLGVKPCGAAHGPGGSGFPEFLADQLTGVAYVGGTLEVNLERVALTNPDLIIGMYPEHVTGEFAADFAPLAPTVYLTEPWRDWRQALREIGLILGKEEVATAKLAEFDARLAEVAVQLEAAIGDEKVMFLRVLPTEIRAYGTASPTGDLLFNRLGLTPAAGVPIGEHAQSISLELIPAFDANHLFLLDQTEDQMAAIKTNPLWQTIPAVQNGNIYPVDVKIWIQGEGLLAYTQLVADVLWALAGDSR
jgi:iron complex transport system substrate-binding protein